jgi:hypothetical protein
MNAEAQAEAHLQRLQEEKEGLQADIAGHLTNAMTRKAAGNKTGALSHLKRRKIKEDRIAAIDTRIGRAQALLRVLRQTASSRGAAAEADRVSAILSKSLLPEMSEEELTAALRDVEHAVYLRNMERGMANAVAVPGSAAAYQNSVARTTLPAVVLPESGPGPRPVNPGVPMMSPYPVRIGGNSRKRRLRKSRSRRNKTARRSLRRA